jgi:DNA-binding SARP family transcriptional activator
MDARYLVEHASDAAFAVDEDLKIVAWNYRARALLGYTRREVIGKRCSEVLQIVLPDGEPLCVPGCEGGRCFDHFKPFTAASCLARHKDCRWVSLGIASVVTPKRDRLRDRRVAVAAVLLRSNAGQAVAPSSGGAVLHIFTFGRFGLATGGHGLSVEKWERKQALTLLKLLAANLGRAVSRDILIDSLWPEADGKSGWERLKVTVYSLRRQLRSAGIGDEIVETADKAYRLRREAVWVDSHVFETCIANGSAYQGQQRWDEALDRYGEARRLYRGHYMSEDIHADWCAEERERLREIHMEMLTDMASCHAELDCYSEAVAVCRAILVDDPCREGVHRRLMEYLIRLGHFDSALAQYRHCRRVLAEELAVEPMPETQRLYRWIVSGEAAGTGQAAE